MVGPQPARRGRPPRPRGDVDLRALREAAGLSGRAAAARVGVPWSTWRGWESLGFAPPPGDLDRIVAALRTPEDGLELEAG